MKRRLTSATITLGLAAGPARGERHERLGVAEEIDRPVIGPAFIGAAEGGEAERSALLPIPSATRRDTRTCSRPCESSSAISAIAGERRSSRMAFRRTSSLRRQLRRQPRQPSDLALDLADELADLDGRACCLLALGRREQLLLLAIGEPDVEAGVDGERGKGEGDDRVEIFAEQPARRRPQMSLVDRLVHSRISSARASSVNGIFNPSARATVRLIRSSYFRGDCTGRSPALVPRRMRST